MQALDVGLAVAECQIGCFHQLKHGLAARDGAFRGIGKDCISLKLMNGQELFDLHADRFQQICQDLMGMIELCPRDKRGVARNIGKKQITVLSRRAHRLLIQD